MSGSAANLSEESGGDKSSGLLDVAFDSPFLTDSKEESTILLGTSTSNFINNSMSIAALNSSEGESRVQLKASTKMGGSTIDKGAEILFNVLLDSLVKCKRVDLAMHLFKSNCCSDGNSASSQLTKPDQVTFNTLFKGCAQARWYAKAVNLFDTMHKMDLEPNDVTYNSMIDVCVRCEEMEHAWHLLDEMRSHQIKPDNFTLSTLIKGIKPDL